MTVNLIPPPGERIPLDALMAPDDGFLLEWRKFDFGDYPHIIPGLLPVGVALLWARPGIGKSMLSLQMEMSIACRRVIAGWRPEEAGRVLIIDYEAGAIQTQQMTLRVAEYMSLDADQDTDEGRALAQMIDYRQSVPGVTFTERLMQLQEWLIEARAEGRPYSIVRIDTLVNFVGSAPQTKNAYEWAGETVGPLNKLAQAHGCAVILVHHPNKMGEISGSTGIEGKCTVSWRIDRERQESDGKLFCSKNRVAREDCWDMYYHPEGIWEFTTLITKGQGSCTGTRRRILDILAEYGPTESRTIRAMMPDVKLQAGKNAITYLRDKGWISRTGDNRWAMASPIKASTPTETPVISQEQEDDGGLERCQVCGEMITGADGHPDCTPAPEGAKRWDSFGAMRRTLEGSRMHPMWFVPRDERADGAWPAAILADRGAEAGYRWTAPGLDTLDPATLVAPLDRSQSFTSACSSVPLAAGKLHHTGPMDFDPKDKAFSEHGVAGIALVTVPDGPEGMPHPLGRRAVPGEEIWIPTGRLELLWKLHADGAIARPAVLDSWTGRRTVGLLDGYAEAVRDARAEFAGDPEMTAAVKRSASTALRCLYPVSAKSPWWRPDWRAAVVGEAGDRLWMVAYRAVKAGAVLAGMGNVDQVAYLVPADLGYVTEWIPDGYKLGRDPGTYHAGTTRVRTGTDLSVPGRAAPDPRLVEVGERVTAITGPLSLGTWLARRA